MKNNTLHNEEKLRDELKGLGFTMSDLMHFNDLALSLAMRETAVEQMNEVLEQEFNKSKLN